MVKVSSCLLSSRAKAQPQLDWAEIAEDEEICDLDDKNGGVRFFWQLVQLVNALVSQMGCYELFIFENGQPMTTPPPKVSFWAFRLTVSWLQVFVDTSKHFSEVTF